MAAEAVYFFKSLSLSIGLVMSDKKYTRVWLTLEIKISDMDFPYESRELFEKLENFPYESRRLYYHTE